MPHHSDQLEVIPESKLAALLDMTQSLVVTSQLEFTKTEHGPGGACFLLDLCGLLKSLGGFLVVIVIVIERCQIPPTLRPLRFEAKGFEVERYCFVDPVAIASCTGFRGQHIEVLRRDCGRLAFINATFALRRRRRRLGRTARATPLTQHGCRASYCQTRKQSQCSSTETQRDEKMSNTPGRLLDKTGFDHIALIIFHC